MQTHTISATTIVTTIAVIIVSVIAASITFTPAHAHAATTWYANSSTGSDSSGDGTSGSPFRSFTKAYASSTAGDTINLTGTFTLTDSVETGTSSPNGFTIGKNLTITGQNATNTIVQAAVASGTAQSRVFTVSTGVTATIENLNIRNGRPKVGYSYYGGAIQNNGTLYVIADEIDNNVSDNGGAGIDNLNLLTVASSTIDNNLCNGSTGMGCGVLSDYNIVAGGYTTITDSTIAYNTITATTGYLSGAGVHFRNGSGTITNSTIAYNTSCESAVGMDTTSGILTIKNTIIADNLYYTGQYCSSGIPVNFAYRSSGRGNVVDNGNNIIGYSYYYTSWNASGEWYDSTHSGTFKQQTTNATGTVNLATTLAQNSSAFGTPTLALSVGSIAIDNGGTGANGATSTVPNLDQRGATRAGVGSTTDIGAYEYDGTVVGMPPPDVTPTSVSAVAAVVESSSTATTTSATITWATTSAASSRVFFGPTSSYGSSTAESDVSLNVTSHSMTLSALVPCAFYHYEVVSRISGIASATSSDMTMNTSGCTGSSTISAVAQGSVATSTGGTVSGTGVTLLVPFGFTSTSTSASSIVFQENRLDDGAAFFATAGSPSGVHAVGTTVFDLVAFADATTTIATFAKSLTVTLSYSASDVAGLDTSTLKIYRYDSGVWTALDSCSTDTNAMTVTCSTNNFSSFAIFGATIAAASSSASGSDATVYASVGGGGTVQSQYASLIAFGEANEANQLIQEYPWLFASTSTSVVTSASTTANITTSSNTVGFTRFLEEGMKGDDVLRLQQFLNEKGFEVASSGPGSPGNEADYFGALTKSAVAKFQEANASQILILAGLKKGTGVFGYYTISAVNRILRTGR